MRQRIYELVSPAKGFDYPSQAYDFFMTLVAILSLLPMVAELKAMPATMHNVLTILDVVTAYILLLDYVFRWITNDIKRGTGVKAFFTYPFSPVAIIDILAILPTLNLIPQTLRFLRILRIIKVFRYSRNLVVITNACRREARTLVSVFMAVVLYMLTVALIVYSVEPESFTSYFDAVCWAATQLTSVTFSPSCPASDVGKAVSILSALVALMMVALPSGVITASYLRELESIEKDRVAYFKKSGPIVTLRRTVENPKTWLSKNRKILRYLTVIVLSIIVTVVLNAVLQILNAPIWVDQIGTALAAFLLEPAAGVIVGFATGVAQAIYYNDSTCILYAIMYVVTAVAFSHLFPRKESNHKILRIVATFLLLAWAVGTVEGLIFALESNASFTEACTEYTFVVPLVNAGASPAVAVSLGIYIEKAIQSAILIAIFAVVSLVFDVRIDPSDVEVVQQEAILEQYAASFRKDDEEEKSIGVQLDANQQVIIQQLASISKRLDGLESTNAKLAAGYSVMLSQARRSRMNEPAQGDTPAGDSSSEG